MEHRFFARVVKACEGQQGNREDVGLSNQTPVYQGHAKCILGPLSRMKFPRIRMVKSSETF